MSRKWYHIFLLDKEKGKSDAKLRLRVMWNGNIVAFNVGYRVDIAKWSADTQRCKNNTTHGRKKVQAYIINKELNRLESIVDELISKYDKNSIDPDKDQFRRDFLKEARGVVPAAKKINSNDNFFQIFDTFIHECGLKNSWADGTFRKFDTVKKHLMAFNKSLTFQALDERGLGELVAFLRDENDMRNSSIEKQLVMLRWFLRWATTKGYNDNSAFETFRPKFKKTENNVVFLEWEELMAVYNHVFTNEQSSLEHVRDIFCFCCFTSLRYSDVAHLTRNNVYDTHITITTIKTDDTVKIELNKYSKAILDKYKGVEYLGGMALPIISNQRMNKLLKIIGKICGLNRQITYTYYKGHERIEEVHPKYEMIGTHTGRRTFICNALMLGISPEVVMKWTGHSDYKTMKPYIDVADSTKQMAMNLFNKK